MRFWKVRPSTWSTLAGVALLRSSPHVSASWLEAFAVTSGYPVPAMALSALWSNAAIRRYVGGLGLFAWSAGWHSPFGLRSCQGLSLLVAASGLESKSAFALVVLVAASWRPPR